MNSSNKIVSYWTEHTTITTDFFEDKVKGDKNHFNIIYGSYNHKNEDEPRPSVGIYLDNHPINGHGITTPMTIPYYVAMDILEGMLKREEHKLKEIQKAIEFMKKHSDTIK